MCARGTGGGTKHGSRLGARYDQGVVDEEPSAAELNMLACPASSQELGHEARMLRTLLRAEDLVEGDAAVLQHPALADQEGRLLQRVNCEERGSGVHARCVHNGNGASGELEAAGKERLQLLAEGRSRGGEEGATAVQSELFAVLQGLLEAGR